MTLTGITDTAEFWRRLEAAHGSLMFDIGANGGGTTHLFSKRFVQVVAVEPCAESFNALRELRSDSIIPLCVAVSDHEGTVMLREAERSIRTGQLVTGSFHAGWGDTIRERQIACVTVDSLAETYGTPTAVKVDVEGHELHVMQGATNVIQSYPTWFIEVHSRSFLDPICELLDGYAVEVIRHSAYPPDSAEWHDHFYLVAS